MGRRCWGNRQCGTSPRLAHLSGSSGSGGQIDGQPPQPCRTVAGGERHLAFTIQDRLPNPGSRVRRSLQHLAFPVLNAFAVSDAMLRVTTSDQARTAMVTDARAASTRWRSYASGRPAPRRDQCDGPRPGKSSRRQAAAVPAPSAGRASGTDGLDGAAASVPSESQETLADAHLTLHTAAREAYHRSQLSARTLTLVQPHGAVSSLQNLLDPRKKRTPDRAPADVRSRLEYSYVQAADM